MNGVQASDRGDEVIVSVSTLPDQLCVELSDQGCGIPASELESIFDPFFTTKENGTGLGLAIAANIVAQHDGRLLGTPNAGRGMTFRLLLPREQRDLAHADRRPEGVVRL